MSTMVNLGIGFQFKSLWLVQVLNHCSKFRNLRKERSDTGQLFLHRWVWIIPFQLNPRSLSASNASNLVFLLAQFFSFAVRSLRRAFWSYWAWSAHDLCQNPQKIYSKRKPSENDHYPRSAKNLLHLFTFLVLNVSFDTKRGGEYNFQRHSTEAV